MGEIVLRLKNITKVFPHPEQPVIANDHISLDIQKGEVHALVGENGTGKSTLMNILYGLLAPDSGEIFLKGHPVRFKTPRDAIAHGIGMVHQHFMLVPSFTVAENLVFTFEPKKGIFVDVKEAHRITANLSQQYGLAVDPGKKISECSLSMRQRVEILKILFHGAELLIFDEPTAVLTPQESQELFKAFQILKLTGKSIIFITHKLREVMAVADRATVMRKGKVVNTVMISHCVVEDLVEMMVGRRIDVSRRKIDGRKMRSLKKSEPILSVKRLFTPPNPSGITLQDISFSVNPGDIVGIAGIGGNGQELVVEAVSGLLKCPKGGTIWYHSRDITNADAQTIRSIGIAHITGERYVRGISVQSDIFENLIMGSHRDRRYSKNIFMDLGKLKLLSQKLVQEYDIKTNSLDNNIMNLSGGNIQKCILAREMNLANELIIAEEPTRGVDIGSVSFIHQRLVERTEAGYGVLLVSTDLDEILSLSTRILVMFKGRIIGEADPEEPNIETKIGLMMAGISPRESES